MRGPRRFCSFAFQFLMRPLTTGAKARSRRVCRSMENAFISRQGRKSEVRSPKFEGRPKSETRNPKPPRQAVGENVQSGLSHPKRTLDFGLWTLDFSRS